jgi:hypothetical protein
MYWLAKRGIKRRTTAVIPAVAYRAATARPIPTTTADD